VSIQAFPPPPCLLLFALVLAKTCTPPILPCIHPCDLTQSSILQKGISPTQLPRENAVSIQTFPSSINFFQFLLCSYVALWSCSRRNVHPPTLPCIQASYSTLEYVVSIQTFPPITTFFQFYAMLLFTPALAETLTLPSCHTSTHAIYSHLASFKRAPLPVNSR
jgi:hypothetical protein